MRRRDILAALRRGEQVEHFETIRVAKDGRRVAVSLMVSPIRDPSGRIVGASKIARDITARQCAEQALQASEKRLRVFFEHVPAPIAMLDREMGDLVVSRRWLRDFHLGERDIIGLSHYEVFPDLPTTWKEVLRRCLDGAIERRDEDRFERGDGTLQWIRWEVRPWLLTAGAIGGIIIFSEEITARKQAEQAFRDRERRAANRHGRRRTSGWSSSTTTTNSCSPMRRMRRSSD